MNTDNKKEQNEQCTIPVVSNSSSWWNSLSSIERDEYFNMYYRDMERMDLLRTSSVDELDSCDIEQIYDEYYC